VYLVGVRPAEPHSLSSDVDVGVSVSLFLATHSLRARERAIYSHTRLFSVRYA
jgi:hypothetical protein